MQIEEFFRDVKSKRSGWSLRDTGLTRPERLDRLILILALAYLLLVGLGLCAAARLRPGSWPATTAMASTAPFRLAATCLTSYASKSTSSSKPSWQTPKSRKHTEDESVWISIEKDCSVRYSTHSRPTIVVGRSPIRKCRLRSLYA